MTDIKSMRAQQVKDKAAVQKLSMTEADYQLANPKGHKRRYRQGGGYSWTNSWTPNDGHGKATRIGHEINRGMAAFDAADNARFGALQERIERVAMRDADGGIHFVEPGRADAAARSNGWGHSFRVARVIKKAGLEGMLFTMFKDEWVPSGRWCAGEPHAFSKPPELGNTDGTMALSECYEDPDGYYWRYVQGEWRRF